MDGFKKRLPLLFTVFSIWGCSSTHAPDGWIPSREETRRDVFGSWIQVTTSEYGEQEYHGELLAMQSDSLFLLDSSGLRGIRLQDIREANITSYKSEAGYAAGAFLLGLPALLSHGRAAVASIPIWIVLSGAAIIVSANENSRSYPRRGEGDAAWEGINQFARFPQGLPASIPRDQLRAKPCNTNHGGFPILYAALYAISLAQFIIGIQLANGHY